MRKFIENNYPKKSNSRTKETIKDGHHIENSIRNLENKKEYWSKNLNESLKSISDNIFKEHLGTQENPLNKDGTIDMAKFAINKEGGFYTTNERKQHKRIIRENEMLWIVEKGLEEEKEEEKEEKEEEGIRELIKKYLEESKKFENEEINKILEKYSKKESNFWDLQDNQKAVDAVLEQFNNEKEKSFGILWEKAKTVLFNEIIGSDFFVVRASTFDDQINKTDNLVINKENGGVAGAFDEVTTEEKSNYHKKKLEKVQKKNREGGTTVYYGITVEGDKIVKTKLKNVPILALQISRSELIDLLEAICSTDENDKNKNDKTKKDIFIKIINSSKQQAALLENKKNIKSNRSFNNLSNLLNQIEGIAEKRFPNVIEE